jgi:hypothetical protein
MFYNILCNKFLEYFIEEAALKSYTGSQAI